MPPKVRITKEQLLNKAFEIMKTEGFSQITARRLAKELGCSTQPVYYAFKNMADLKKELYKISTTYFEERVKSLKGITAPELDFLEAGVAYIQAAKQEHNLFHFICMENNYALGSVSDLVRDVPLPPNQARLFLNLWLYAHGIACIIANNDVAFRDDEIRELLLNAYKGFSAPQE